MPLRTFYPYLSRLICSSMLPPKDKTDEENEHGENILYNWSGIQSIARKNQMRHPERDSEVADLVKNAKSKIHVIGTGLSYEKLCSLALNDPDAILLNLTNFTGLIRTTPTTATFGAATSVNQVVATLSKMDRMMTCSLGVIGIQTLVGAMSTGTHGQGLFQSDYSTTVTSLKVVLPSGTIRTITETDEDLPLASFTMALGMLGIILEIEIRTESRRVFHCRKLTLPYKDFLENYGEWNKTYENVKVWWFPATDLCHIWLVENANPVQTAAFLATDQATSLKVGREVNSLNATVDQYLASMSLDTKASAESDEPRFETVRRFSAAVDLVGYHEQILCKGIPAAQVNCEIAVPLDRFVAATEALHKWSESQPESSLHYPFIYRAAGHSSAWLSAAYSGPVVWIGFLVYVAADGTVRDDGMETMDTLQQILCKFQGAPHWGKHFQEANFDFYKVIEKFPDFLSLRRRLDPQNKLLSLYLDKIFH